MCRSLAKREFSSNATVGSAELEVDGEGMKVVFVVVRSLAASANLNWAEMINLYICYSN